MTISFRIYRRLDPDLRFFWRILPSTLRDRAFFHNSAHIHISGKKWTDLHENSTIDVSFNKEVPVKFWKLPVSGLWIRTRLALAEVYALRMLALFRLHICPSYSSTATQDKTDIVFVTYFTASNSITNTKTTYSQHNLSKTCQLGRYVIGHVS